MQRLMSRHSPWRHLIAAALYIAVATIGITALSYMDDDTPPPPTCVVVTNGIACGEILKPL
jgi:hypothetical protein